MQADATQTVGGNKASAPGRAAGRWQWITVATMFAWAGTFMGATFILGDEYYGLESLVGYGLGGASIILGVLSVYAYWNFLHHCDELQQRIQLNGLALGFGVGLVFMMGYRLLERMGAPVMDVNDPVFIMTMSYVLGVLISNRSYR